MLGAALMLAWSIGAGSAVADDPNMNGGDGRVVAQAFDPSGNLWMAYQEPGHGLAVTINYQVNDSWNGPLRYIASGNVYSTPSITFDTFGNLFIAYQGLGHTLMAQIRKASDGSWFGPVQVENVNSVYSSPSMTLSHWGDIFVTYQGPDHSLATSVRQGSDGTWHKYPIHGPGTTYSTPAQAWVNMYDGKHLLISYVGPDHRLSVTDRYPNDGSWNGPYSFGGTNVAYSAPGIVTDKFGQLFIGVEGYDHSFNVLAKTPQDWLGPYKIGDYGKTLSAPSLIADSGGNVFAAYQGPNHSWYEMVRYASDASWNGPYNLLNENDTLLWAPTESYNTTTGRITVAMQGRTNNLITVANGASWHRTPSNPDNNIYTGDKYWPTSAKYGGEFDGHVDTNDEAAKVVDAYEQAPSHAAARQLLNELDPADLPLVERVMRDSIHEGDLILNMDNGYVYLYADYRLHYLDFSIGMNIGAESDMAHAKRRTANSLSTLTLGDPIGNYPTSWQYGGTNHAVDTGDEVAAVIAAYDARPSDADVDALLRGLSPSDYDRVLAAIPSADAPGAPSGTVAETYAQNVNFMDDDLVEAASTLSFDNNLCPTSNPCGSYDGAAAAAYAHTYYAVGNGNYPDFYDDNCTNFVSQALRAGGFRFLRYNRAEDRGVKGAGSWWVQRVSSAPMTWTTSKSWSVAPVLYQHLVSRGLGNEVLGPTRSFRPGDVLFYDLHGNGIDHASIVTTVKTGKVWVAQSGGKRYERLYADQMSYISQHYSHFGGIRLVRPKYTAVNI